MPINEAAGFVRSSLTKEQKRQAEMVLYGLQEDFVQSQQSDQGKIQEIDLNNPPATPYVHREFPRLMYNHATRKTRVVNDADEMAAAIKAGWKKDPFPAEGAPAPVAEPEPEAAEEAVTSSSSGISHVEKPTKRKKG